MCGCIFSQKQHISRAAQFAYLIEDTEDQKKHEAAQIHLRSDHHGYSEVKKKKQSETLHKKTIDKLDSLLLVLFPWKLFLCNSEEQVKLLAPSQIVSPQSPIRKKRFRSCSGSKRDPTHDVLTRSWSQTSSHAVTPILYNGNLSFN